MKKNFNILVMALALSLSSCEDWLSQEDATALSVEQAYASVNSISSIAANLYSRLRYEQDFGLGRPGEGLMDLARWDECCQSSSYWDQAGNVNRDYRNYYDYSLIRELNIHIRELENSAISISEEQKKYFLAEARYMRAYVYFTLVSRMGGVPLITEVFEYTNNPIELARPRNKESEVYDFIVSELDAVINDFGTVGINVKTRATKGAALALKCRAMLYAGSLAYRYDENVKKGLILPSGAVGIPKEKAKDYFQKCIDAYLELKELGYSLYKNNSDLAANYAELFQTSKGNPEVIFCRDYDGVNFKNPFTTKCICAEMASGLKTGCELSPTLNQVNAYERLSIKHTEPINPYDEGGQTFAESMVDGISNHKYKVYDTPDEIFQDRDPRLNGSILMPGSSFRGMALDFQAGLAIKQSDRSYLFKTVDGMENLNDPVKNTYNGERITGKEGPHRITGYYSHSGFLMRKFVDVASGSEVEGASTVPYIIFRYGEVLLNAAEAAYCLNELGVASYKEQNMAELALNCLNEVRERAGGVGFRLAAGELDFDRIINERRVELAYEDHRYNDLKRWRLADQVWKYDVTNETSVMKGLWPYKVVSNDGDNGKWIYRIVLLDHRGSLAKHGDPLNFDLTMYYATYPQNEGNPYIEKNPNH